MQCRIAERHYALLATLARDLHQLVLKINVRQIQLSQLGDAHARPVKQLKDGAVAFAKVCFRVGSFDKADRVFDGEMVGQLLFQARRGNEFRRIHFDDAFADEELKEGAQRRELARNGGLLLLRRMKAGEPLAYCDVIDLAYINFTARALRVGWRKVVVELAEVARVITQRVLADVTLIAQVLEKLSE